jgi:hypothetical protein
MSTQIDAVIQRTKRVLDRPRRCSCGDCNACATDKLLADLLDAFTTIQRTDSK